METEILFGGIEEMVNKKLGPVVQSIEHKLTPELQKLSLALARNSDALETHTKALKELRKSADKLYDLLDGSLKK